MKVPVTYINSPSYKTWRTFRREQHQQHIVDGVIASIVITALIWVIVVTI